MQADVIILAYLEDVQNILYFREPNSCNMRECKLSLNSFHANLRNHLLLDILPTPLHGSENWTLDAEDESRITYGL
jgi:hypothetical protein